MRKLVGTKFSYGGHIWQVVLENKSSCACKTITDNPDESRVVIWATAALLMALEAERSPSESTPTS